MVSTGRFGSLAAVIAALSGAAPGCGSAPTKAAGPGADREPPVAPRIAVGDCAIGDSVRFVAGPRHSPTLSVAELQRPWQHFRGEGGTGDGIERPGTSRDRDGGMRGRPTASMKVRIGQASTAGKLDKDIIRRRIRSRLARIRRCYERELLKNPGLAGTATAELTIAASGRVSQVAVTGFDEVAPCLERTLRSLVFPRPRGGGQVKVRYPFVFRGGSGGATSEPEPAKADSEEATPEREQDAERAGILGALNAPPRTVESPLSAHRERLASCLAAGSENDHGVAVLELVVGEGGTVAGSATYGATGLRAADCLAAVGRGLSWRADPGTYRCPIAFGELDPAAAPGLDITRDAIRAGGAELARLDAIIRDEGRVRKIAAVYELARRARSDEVLGAPGPLVIRPMSETPMKVVARVVRSLEAAGSSGWVLAAESGAGWRLLRDLELPAVPVPIPSPFMSSAKSTGRISILVGEVELWVGASGGERRRFGATGDGRDWEPVVGFLAKLRGTPAPGGGPYLEIAAADAVPYRDFVAAVDAARRAGFTDFRLVAADSLSLSATR
jgi:hypothetical protein